MTQTQIVPRVVPFKVIICMPKQWALCTLLALSFFPFKEIFLILIIKGEKLHTKVMQNIYIYIYKIPHTSLREYGLWASYPKSVTQQHWTYQAYIRIQTQTKDSLLWRKSQAKRTRISHHRKHYRISSRRFSNSTILVIVKKSSPKNLSADS